MGVELLFVDGPPENSVDGKTNLKISLKTVLGGIKLHEWLDVVSFVIAAVCICPSSGGRGSNINRVIVEDASNIEGILVGART